LQHDECEHAEQMREDDRETEYDILACALHAQFSARKFVICVHLPSVCTVGLCLRALHKEEQQRAPNENKVTRHGCGKHPSAHEANHVTVAANQAERGRERDLGHPR
jgi:hypothetical protein